MSRMTPSVANPRRTRMRPRGSSRCFCSVSAIRTWSSLTTPFATSTSPMSCACVPPVEEGSQAGCTSRTPSPAPEGQVWNPADTGRAPGGVVSGPPEAEGVRSVIDVLRRCGAGPRHARVATRRGCGDSSNVRCRGGLIRGRAVRGALCVRTRLQGADALQHRLGLEACGTAPRQDERLPVEVERIP